MRYSREAYLRLLSLQQDVVRAHEAYQQLRDAYLQVARDEPGHEVAMAMIGADMDRAQARLRALVGSDQPPGVDVPSQDDGGAPQQRAAGDYRSAAAVPRHAVRHSAEMN